MILGAISCLVLMRPVIYKDCRLLDLPKTQFVYGPSGYAQQTKTRHEVPGFSMEQGPFRSGVRWMRPVPLDIPMVFQTLYGLWLFLLVGGGG